MEMMQNSSFWTIFDSWSRTLLKDKKDGRTDRWTDGRTDNNWPDNEWDGRTMDKWTDKGRRFGGQLSNEMMKKTGLENEMMKKKMQGAMTKIVKNKVFS